MGMCSTLRKVIHEEVQLVESFTRSYRAKLGGLIDRINRSPAGTLPSNAAWQSIRWCVEAVDLMLSSQAQFAKVMNEIAEGARGEAKIPITKSQLEAARHGMPLSSFFIGI
jgi:hypothetical protein